MAGAFKAKRQRADGKREKVSEARGTMVEWARKASVRRLPAAHRFEAVGNQVQALQCIGRYQQEAELLVPFECFARMVFEDYWIATTVGARRTIEAIATLRFRVPRTVVHAHLLGFVPPALTRSACELLHEAAESLTRQVAQHAAYVSSTNKRHFVWASDVELALRLSGLGARLPPLPLPRPRCVRPVDRASPRDLATIRDSGASPNPDAARCECANSSDALLRPDDRSGRLLRAGLRALCHRMGIKFAPEATLRAFADTMMRFCLGARDVARSRPFSRTCADDLASFERLKATVLERPSRSRRRRRGDDADVEEEEESDFSSDDESRESDRLWDWPDSGLTAAERRQPELQPPSFSRGGDERCVLLDRARLRAALREMRLNVYEADEEFLFAGESERDDDYSLVSVREVDAAPQAPLVQSTGIPVGVVVGCCPRCDFAPVFVLREWPEARRRDLLGDEKLLADVAYEEVVLSTVKAAQLVRALEAGHFATLDLRRLLWSESGDAWASIVLADDESERVNGFDDDWRSLRRELHCGQSFEVWSATSAASIRAGLLREGDLVATAIHAIAMRHVRYVASDSVSRAAEIATRWLLGFMELVGTVLVQRDPNSISDLATLADAALALATFFSLGRDQSLYGGIVPALAIERLLRAATRYSSNLDDDDDDDDPTGREILPETDEPFALLRRVVAMHHYPIEGFHRSVRTSRAAASLVALALECHIDSLFQAATALCVDSTNAVAWLGQAQDMPFQPIVLPQHVTLAYAGLPEGLFSNRPSCLRGTSLQHPLVLTYEYEMDDDPIEDDASNIANTLYWPNNPVA